jgi:hypothetical protein
VRFLEDLGGIVVGVAILCLLRTRGGVEVNRTRRATRQPIRRRQIALSKTWRLLIGCADFGVSSDDRIQNTKTTNICKYLQI